MIENEDSKSAEKAVSMPVMDNCSKKSLKITEGQGYLMLLLRKGETY